LSHIVRSGVDVALQGIKPRRTSGQPSLMARLGTRYSHGAAAAEKRATFPLDESTLSIDPSVSNGAVHTEVGIDATSTA
jgi:hypothetical protein